MITELIICIKFGREIFERTQILTIAAWLVIQFLMTLICLGGCIYYHKRAPNKVYKYYFSQSNIANAPCSFRTNLNKIESRGPIRLKTE